MAMLGRKQPAAPQAPPRQPAGAVADNGRFGRLRGNINDIMAELRKVTWPTTEEARNLTIVVIGITVVVGGILASVDGLLSWVYSLINP